MRFSNFLYLIIGILIGIFIIYSYYQWWLDKPWREKWLELQKNPEKFLTNSIELKGNVLNPYTIAGTNISVYTLEFENFKCEVISITGIPEEGSKIIVKGKIKKNYKVESIFMNRKIVKNFSWVIVEEERREEK
jgi:hypothetical protein